MTIMEQKIVANRRFPFQRSYKVTDEENHQVLEVTDENWWARKDSNLRPMDYESTALTN